MNKVNEKYEVLDELSGVAFEPTEELPGGLGSLLSDVGGMFGPAGLAGAGFDLSSSAESRAISGGRFTSGDITFGTSNTVLIVAAVLVGLWLTFGR